MYIGGAGAYCSAMNVKNYNSFPEAAEVQTVFAICLLAPVGSRGFRRRAADQKEANFGANDC